MDYEQVLNLINVIEKSNINTFEIDFENTYLNMSKLDSVAPIRTVETQKIEPIIETVLKAEPKVEVQATETVKTVAQQEGKNEVVITSPIVGTFYESGSEGTKAFVNVGDTVKEGDVVCIIEAMKVMNEIKSKYNGKVTKILVTNESMVEFNQPLFVIE